MIANKILFRSIRSLQIQHNTTSLGTKRLKFLLLQKNEYFFKPYNFYQNHQFIPRFYSTTVHTHQLPSHSHQLPLFRQILTHSTTTSSSSSYFLRHSILLLTTTTLIIPTLYFFFTSLDKAPNTNRLRLMMPLWSWEIGELVKISKQHITQLPTITDQQDPRLQLIDHVINRLWKCGKPKVHLIYDDEMLDGVSYASSDITVTTCWLRFIDYDEELLASVLAHELAHIMQDHAIEFYGVWSLTGFFDQLLFFTSNHNSSNKYIKRYLEKHSQELEKEADLLGQQIMARSGYNPMKAIELWEKMKELDEMNNNIINTGEGIDHNIKSENVNPSILFKHHPSKSQRIEYLKDNLINVQHFYDQIVHNNKYEGDSNYKFFDKDLSLRRLELTTLAVFGIKVAC
ncbi:23592_t:CDS:2 [Entrophospora sp. SA101]|nr:23592_t:CDS:2 [Entrophospora sp. SA101]CAJ0866911.1 9524_t:CDS:2 [Entrophospora sp. SA101]CAJ0894151.1 17370_t:CDS:2 [Entrophospora sp. SA101]